MLDAEVTQLNAIPGQAQCGRTERIITLPKSQWLTQHEKYGFESYLTDIDTGYVRGAMHEVGDFHAMQFPDPRFRRVAELAYQDVMREHNCTSMQHVSDKVFPRLRNLYRSRSSLMFGSAAFDILV